MGIHIRGFVILNWNLPQDLRYNTDLLTICFYYLHLVLRNKMKGISTFLNTAPNQSLEKTSVSECVKWMDGIEVVGWGTKGGSG